MKKIALEAQPWGWSQAIEPRYQPLIERLETEAAANPQQYRRAVLGGALLGYVVLFGLIAALLGVIGGIIAFAVASNHVNAAEIKIVFFLAIPAFLVLRALWVRLDPPQGRSVTRDEAPELFISIEAIRVATLGPHLHAVLMTDNFNAAIVQHPRFGLFGGHNNYLLLGLPLMQALDTRAFEAVLAHEFGHLANADGKLGSWIYRVRMTWARLSESLGSGGTGAILRRFFAWYGPWFNAYSFVLARQNEYAADAMSARATSPADAARALATVAVEADRFQNEHWRAVFDAIDHHAAPPAMPFGNARAFFAEPSAGRSGPLARALAVPTGLDDTHPALAQRLAALGQPAPDPTPCIASAADQLLRDGGKAIADEFDSAWWQTNADAWANSHNEARGARERLTALDAAAAGGSIAPADRFSHAFLTERLGDVGDAEAMYAALITDPGEPIDVDLSRFAVARLRLARGDGSALTDLSAFAAVPREPDDIANCVAIALDYFDRYALSDPARSQWLALAQSNAARAELLHAELNNLTERSELGEADLTPPQTETLVAIGIDFPEVSRIYVARRPLGNGPPDRQHILLFESQAGMGPARVGLFIDTVLGILSATGPALAIQFDKDRKWLRKRVNKIDGTLIYDKRAQSR